MIFIVKAVHMQLLIKRRRGQDVWHQRERGRHVTCCGYSSHYFGGFYFHVCATADDFCHLLACSDIVHAGHYTIEQCLMSVVLFLVVNAQNDPLFDCEWT